MSLLTGNFRKPRCTVTTTPNPWLRLPPKLMSQPEFGLPQIRERALVVAVRDGLIARTVDDLWAGYAVSPDALTVKRAIGHLRSLHGGR